METVSVKYLRNRQVGDTYIKAGTVGELPKLEAEALAKGRKPIVEIQTAKGK